MATHPTAFTAVISAVLEERTSNVISPAVISAVLEERTSNVISHTKSGLNTRLFLSPLGVDIVCIGAISIAL